MHATEPQGAARPDTTETGSPTAALIGLLTDHARFNAWIGNAVITAAQPMGTPELDTVDRYNVTEEGLRALTEPVPGDSSVTAAKVLRSAASYLERYGWIQGAYYYDATAATFTPAACMVGAIGMVCYGGPVEAPAQHFDDPGYLDFEEAVLHLDRYLLVADGTEAYEFNDAKGRTAAEVIDALRKAAAATADELIGALSVLNGRHAYRASEVGGGVE
jgi:hypothetical protein